MMVYRDRKWSFVIGAMAFGVSLVIAILAVAGMWFETYAANVPEIFIGTFYDEWIGKESEEIAQIQEVDFKAVDGQKVTVYGELNGAFEGDTLLKTVDLTGFDPAGVEDYTDIFAVSTDKPLILKGASDSFIKEVAPLLEEQNRYLGMVKVTAKVTLKGKDMAADLFKFNLYRDSVNNDNLIKSVKNAEDGSIDFGNKIMRSRRKQIPR